MKFPLSFTLQRVSVEHSGGVGGCTAQGGEHLLGTEPERRESLTDEGEPWGCLDEKFRTETVQD